MTVTLTITAPSEQVADEILDALRGAEEEGEITEAFNVQKNAPPQPDAVAVAELADRFERGAPDLEDLERLAYGNWTEAETYAAREFVGGHLTPDFRRLVCAALMTKATVASGRA